MRESKGSVTLGQQMCLYSIRDRLTKVYAPVWMQYNHDSAVRAFMETRENNPGRFEDQELYFLGTFDTFTGKINPEKSGPVFITDSPVIESHKTEAKDAE